MTQARELDELRSPSEPASRAGLSPAAEVSLELVVSFFEQLAELRQATGCLAFGEKGRAGTLSFEAGRLCFATSPELPRRLTELLRHLHTPPLPRQVLDGAVRAARETGKPFSETLQLLGLATPDGLRRSLRQHIAESIALLAQSGVKLTEGKWQPHQARYDAQFTFSAAEVLTTLGALRDVEAATIARGCMRFVLGAEDTGIAFAESPGPSGLVPLGVQNADRIALREIFEIGRWARGSLQVAACLDSNPIVAAQWGAGVHAVLYQQQALSYVMLCSTAERWARMLGKVRRLSSLGSDVPLSIRDAELGQASSGVRPKASSEPK
ncbi:MAG TPA: hypothetical protein VHM70_10330 [Polyangiaceae bacterium]|nr:hypothetical protein [Polyangiaceae bacterium]